MVWYNTPLHLLDVMWSGSIGIVRPGQLGRGVFYI